MERRILPSGGAQLAICETSESVGVSPALLSSRYLCDAAEGQSGGHWNQLLRLVRCASPSVKTVPVIGSGKRVGAAPAVSSAERAAVWPGVRLMFGRRRRGGRDHKPTRAGGSSSPARGRVGCRQAVASAPTMTRRAFVAGFATLQPIAIRAMYMR